MKLCSYNCYLLTFSSLSVLTFNDLNRQWHQPHRHHRAVPSNYNTHRRQLRTIRRSVSRSVLQSLVTSLVLSRLDYGNATLAGVSSHLLSRLQSVMNAAARLIFSSSKFHHITPLLHQLHWLKAPERIAFKYAVLMYKCLHGSAPAYPTDELCQVADVEARRRLRSSSSSSLIVSRTRLSSVYHRWSSFSGRRCSCLEQSSWSCHVCTFRSCLPVATQNPPV